MFHIRLGSGFNKAFKNLMKQKNYEVTRKISENIYEIVCQGICFEVDVSEARQSYEQSRDAALDNLLLRIELDYIAKHKLTSFQNAQNCLRCLPARESEADSIAVPFLNGLGLQKVLAFTTDDKNIFPLNAEYLKKWNVPKDVLFAVADRNMSEILRRTELYVSTISGKIKVIEFPVENPKLRTALMFCSNFKKLVSDKLGARFLVLAPSQESMLAVEEVKNNVVECFGPVVLQEYQKAECPLSTDVFLFSPSGVSIAGKFKIPEPMEVPAE